MQASEVVASRGQDRQSQRLAHRRFRYTVRVILQDPLAFFSVLVIIALVILALGGPWIAPYPEQGRGRTNVPERFASPSAKYWLGADQLGRDVLSRIIIGSSIALRVPTIVVILAVALGAPLGALAGYVGGGAGQPYHAADGPLPGFPFSPAGSGYRRRSGAQSD